MADRLVDGDYTLISGTKKLRQCDYIDEIMQRVYMILSASRERFYPDKDYGLRLPVASDDPYNFYLQAYAQQAVDSLDGVYIKSAAKLANNSMLFYVVVNDTERTVSINENNI